MSGRHFLAPFLPPLLSLCLTLIELFTGTFASDEEKHYAWMKGGWIGGYRGMAKRLFICQKINVFSLLASFPALTFSPSSISPSSLISYSSVQPHYSCSLSSMLLSGGLTRNDRAFCHGVWNTLNITCQLRDNNGWHRVDTGEARRPTSTHFHLCLNPIIGRLLFFFFSWLEVNECLKMFPRKRPGILTH